MHSGLYPWLRIKYHNHSISGMYMSAVTSCVSVELLLLNFTFLK